MKRSIILFVLSLTLHPCHSADKKTVSDRVGFFVNEVSLGGGFYNDGYENRAIVSATYLFGRHFTERLFGGISATCSYTSYYSGYKYYDERVYNDTFALRILLNGRYFFMAKKFSPYVGLDLGPAYIPGYSKTMSPFAGAQLGCRWLLNTHNVIGFHLEPALSIKGYKELHFKLTFEFL